MKKLLLSLLISLPVFAWAGEDFDRGYELGFKEGYRKVQGQLSVAPVSPVAPVPPVDEDTFFGGYNEGFLAGMAEAGQ